MRPGKDWPKLRQRADGKWEIDCGLVNGKRLRFVRRHKVDANAKAKELRKEYGALGDMALKLSHEQLVEAAQCFTLIEGKGIGLTDAVNYALKGQEDSRLPGLTIPVSQAVSKRVEAMEGANKRDRAVSTTLSRLNQLSALYGGVLIANMRTKHIRSVLATPHWQPATRKGYLREFKTFFDWCIKQGWILANPCDPIDMPTVDHKMPEYMLPDDVKRVLYTMYQANPNCASPAAIGFFAGIRTAELERLKWGDVDLVEQNITIRPEVAKIRRARHVTMSNNLRQWLSDSRFPDPASLIMPPGFKAVRRRACTQLCLPWPPNAMRHSFATYHLAMHKDAGKTATQLGHSKGSELLFTNYRGLATEAESAAYWNIMPPWKDRP